METTTPQMSQETLLARVDERTISISKKLDDVCDSFKDQQAINSKRLGALERWRAYLVGAYAFGAIFVASLFAILLTFLK